MGVAGLWEVIRPAGEVRSLTELAVTDGFVDNPSGQRGFRIGIDASIWFFHAAYGKEGENPELRTLFFRCCRLLQAPLLPLFVFDGPKRPAIKRGKRVGGNAHWLTTGMKNMIQAFGFEYRTAPGEAEAELAYLNRIGVIDAVLSDDVDNFLFGATMVIRNPSNTLSGNRSHPVKNAAGKDDGNHVLTYRSSALAKHPSVQLTRAGTILIALLSGGDYIPAGLPGCGKAFATGLARAGFGDSLVDAVVTLNGRELEEFLDGWREDIRTELRTNKRGLLPTKKPSLASSLPETFPSLPVLLSYVSPITSETERQKSLPVNWPNDPDPKQIAALCELYFEWGVKEVIVKRFRTVLWPGTVCRAVRRAVLDGNGIRFDHLQRDTISPLSNPASSTSASSSQPEPDKSFNLASLVPLTSIRTSLPSSRSSPIQGDPGNSEDTQPPLLMSLLSSRTHASTDSTLEYRVLIDPTSLVHRAEAGVRGIRPPLESGLFAAAVGSDEEEAGIASDEVEESDSDVGDWDIERLETTAAAAKKRTAKTKKSGKKGTPVTPTSPLRVWLPACMLRAAAPQLVETYEARETAKRAKKKSKALRPRSHMKDVEQEPAGEEIDKAAKASRANKTTSRTAIRGAGTGARRRKPKHASEAQDEGYEVIDLSGASSCSSDESIDEGRKSSNPEGAKTKAKEAAKVTLKEKPGSTVKGFFRTIKPTATSSSLTKSKASAPSKSRLLPLYDDDDDDPNDELPSFPPLAKSIRPLDYVKSRSSSIPKSTGRETTMPRPPLVHEEEEGSSNSASSRRPSQTGTQSIGPRAADKPTTREKLASSLNSSSDDDIKMSDARYGSYSGTRNVGTNSITGSAADESRYNTHSVPARSGSKFAHIRLPSDTDERLSSKPQDSDACRSKSGPNDRIGSGDSSSNPVLRAFPMPSPTKAYASSSTTTDVPATFRHVPSPSTEQSPVKPGACDTFSSRPSIEDTIDLLTPSPPSSPSRVLVESHNIALLKSPRKFASHTSPRHVRRRAGSPTSPTAPSSTLDRWLNPPSSSSRTQGNERKVIQRAPSPTPQRESESVIYISSDSEDDSLRDADTAMILTSPPVLPPPPPVFVVTSGITEEQNVSEKGKTSLSVTSTSHSNANGIRSTASATSKSIPPLLAARAKASTNSAASSGSGRSATLPSSSMSTAISTAQSNLRTKARTKANLVSSEDIIDLT